MRKLVAVGVKLARIGEEKKIALAQDCHAARVPRLARAR